jgi:hypothetical protein
MILRTVLIYIPLPPLLIPPLGGKVEELFFIGKISLFLYFLYLINRSYINEYSAYIIGKWCLNNKHILHISK